MPSDYRYQQDSAMLHQKNFRNFDDFVLQAVSSTRHSELTLEGKLRIAGRPVSRNHMIQYNVRIFGNKVRLAWIHKEERGALQSERLDWRPKHCFSLLKFRNPYSSTYVQFHSRCNSLVWNSHAALDIQQEYHRNII